MRFKISLKKLYKAHFLFNSFLPPKHGILKLILKPFQKLKKHPNAAVPSSIYFECRLYQLYTYCRSVHCAGRIIQSSCLNRVFPTIKFKKKEQENGISSLLLLFILEASLLSEIRTQNSRLSRKGVPIHRRANTYLLQSEYSYVQWILNEHQMLRFWTP